MFYVAKYCFLLICLDQFPQITLNLTHTTDASSDISLIKVLKKNLHCACEIQIECARHIVLFSTWPHVLKLGHSSW